MRQVWMGFVRRTEALGLESFIIWEKCCEARWVELYKISSSYVGGASSQLDGLGNILSPRGGQTLPVFLKETSKSVRNQYVKRYFNVTDSVIRVGPFCFILLYKCESLETIPSRSNCQGNHSAWGDNTVGINVSSVTHLRMLYGEDHRNNTNDSSVGFSINTEILAFYYF